MLITDGLILRRLSEVHEKPFAEMHADREVMRDRPATLTYEESLEKLRGYQRAYDQHGISRWAVELPLSGSFLGYVGLLPIDPPLPLPVGFEIGWRLCRSAWGRGYATEAGEAALKDAADRLGISNVLAYTSVNNHQSEAVMKRLQMERRFDLDFVHPNGFTGPVLVCVRCE